MDKFIFLVDFIVFDYEIDQEVPIILGRSFLTTGKTLINVHKGEITIRVKDEHVTFNGFKVMKFPDEVKCSSILIMDSFVSKNLEIFL